VVVGPLPAVFSQVLILRANTARRKRVLKAVRVLCLHTLLEVVILKEIVALDFALLEAPGKQVASKE
jgi:hypothetical protein